MNTACSCGWLRNLPSSAGPQLAPAASSVVFTFCWSVITDRSFRRKARVHAITPATTCRPPLSELHHLSRAGAWGQFRPPVFSDEPRNAHPILFAHSAAPSRAGEPTVAPLRNQSAPTRDNVSITIIVILRSTAIAFARLAAASINPQHRQLRQRHRSCLAVSAATHAMARRYFSEVMLTTQDRQRSIEAPPCHSEKRFVPLRSVRRLNDYFNLASEPMAEQSSTADTQYTTQDHDLTSFLSPTLNFSRYSAAIKRGRALYNQLRFPRQ